MASSFGLIWVGRGTNPNCDREKMDTETKTSTQRTFMILIKVNECRYLNCVKGSIMATVTLIYRAKQVPPNISEFFSKSVLIPDDTACICVASVKRMVIFTKKKVTYIAMVDLVR